MVRLVALTAILLVFLVPTIEAHRCDCAHEHSPVHENSEKHTSDRGEHPEHQHEHDLISGHHSHARHGSEKDSRLHHHHSHEREAGGDGLHHIHRSSERNHVHTPLSTARLWLLALTSSLIVSLASLVCLILLPLISWQGRPSQTLVDSLAAFGAGSMLGDVALHQLPHLFVGSEGHSGHNAHEHDALEDKGHSHVHSFEDISVGLAFVGGILFFFLLEKIVRRREELSVGGHLSHHHHHHSKVGMKTLEEDKDEEDSGDNNTLLDKKPSNSRVGLRKRSSSTTEKLEGTSEAVARDNVNRSGADAGGAVGKDGVEPPELGEAPRLVLGYLNLFSDGVHNFMDGMALGSAFLVHGTVGGWWRTVLLLAHELPQEVGDFGILMRSGFSFFKALGFNFLSALVALAGTSLSLVLGGNAGQSAVIEGFTAGGFIYMSVGAVIPDLHSQGSSLRTTLCQLTALSLGVGVATVISQVESW